MLFSGLAGLGTVALLVALHFMRAGCNDSQGRCVGVKFSRAMACILAVVWITGVAPAMAPLTAAYGKCAVCLGIFLAMLMAAWAYLIVSAAKDAGGWIVRRCRPDSKKIKQMAPRRFRGICLRTAAAEERFYSACFNYSNDLAFSRSNYFVENRAGFVWQRGEFKLRRGVNFAMAINVRAEAQSGLPCRAFEAWLEAPRENAARSRKCGARGRDFEFAHTLSGAPDRVAQKSRPGFGLSPC
jgi:hypothetical protein